MKKLFLLFYFFFSCNSFAQIYNTGLGVYGIQSKHWNCHAMINSLKKLDQIHLSFVYRTFGLNNKCLLKIIKDPRLKTLEIHVINGSGLRRNKHFNYEIFANETPASLNKKIKNNNKKTLKKFKREINRINRTIISKLRSDQICLISPILEHNLSNQSARKLMKFLKKIIPSSCLLVNNPLGGGTFSGADIYERHGNNTFNCLNCINNLDGTDIEFITRAGLKNRNIHESQLPKFINNNRKLLVNFLWIREFNGIVTKNLEIVFKNPRKRINFSNEIMFNHIVKYIFQAQHTFKIPAYTKKYKKSLNNCQTIIRINRLKSEYFIWKRLIKNNKDLTIIDFNNKYKEIFEFVNIFYKGKLLTNFQFDNFYNNKQRWIVEQPIYTFPYHIVMKTNNGMCFEIRNPKIKNGIK